MDSPSPDLPDDLDALRAVAAAALAQNADDAATIALQLLEIAKLKRQIYGPRSERTARLRGQMELELEDLEAAATEDEIAAEKAAKTTTVAPYARKRPSRQPFHVTHAVQRFTQGVPSPPIARERVDGIEPGVDGSGIYERRQ